jgi:hypothetical protein
MYALRLQARGPVWHNAVAISWSAPDAAPARVTLDRSDSGWIFRAGERTVFAG